MQLQIDKSLHLHRTHPHLTPGTSERPKLRSIPMADATPTENLRNELSDQGCVLKQGDYAIFLADSAARRKEANALIKRMYSWRGYNTEDAAVTSPNQTSLEAYSGSDLIGTLTLGVDSKEGLLADELYNQEISMLRATGRKVCELSKLAIDPIYSSKELLASLFNLAYICGRIIHKATDFIIEINPRHAAYYKRMLGFDQISEIRTCQRVNAPAVLLHLNLEYVETEVSRLAGLRKSGERSLYSHFLTKAEEKKVADKAWGRLNRLAEQELFWMNNRLKSLATLCG